jgi:hypothetical protein
MYLHLDKKRKTRARGREATCIASGVLVVVCERCGYDAAPEANDKHERRMWIPAQAPIHQPQSQSVISAVTQALCSTMFGAKRDD